MCEPATGFIPWREFMRLALYDPEFGYYTRKVRGVGGEGDFTTVPEATKIFADAVAKWWELRADWVRKGKQVANTLHFLEIGAGSGAFARRFLSRYIWSFRRPTYLIVEISPPLLNLQQKQLGSRHVRWFADVAEALRFAQGCTTIFSNELVDAFPCSRWVFLEGEWQELGIVVEGEQFRECARRVRQLPQSTVFHVPAYRCEGQIVETHESFRDWLQGWKGELRHAVMLIVDYGGSVQEIYDRRPQGSLRAYRHQQRITGTGMYASIGQQDLTADVNFTDLSAWLQEIGWQISADCTLAEWIGEMLGDGGRRVQLRDREKERDSARRVLDEFDAGGAFRVLEAVWDT